MTIREFYTLVGGSYDDMSERFPSDALILRFLTMLPQDGSMELLARSVDAADAKTAFRAVHTLKGVALNLGLTALAGVCSEMTEALRGSDTLPASAPALFEAVQREYDKVTGALVQLTRMSDTERPARIELIDALRGLAVCLMVLHHFLYDLCEFLGAPWWCSPTRCSMCCTTFSRDCSSFSPASARIFLTATSSAAQRRWRSPSALRS